MAKALPHLLLLSLIFTTLIGCSSSVVIQDVPPTLRAGKLYLTPGTARISGQTFDTDEGYIVVNESPSDTTTRKNMLPVLRIRSSDRNPGEPIFWLNGGPGQSNMSYQQFRTLLEHHDFVLVGYRGVDGSVVLRSDEVEDAMKGVGSDLLGDESLESISKAAGSFCEKLKAEGIDLSHYTIVDVVSDLEAARKALNYDKVDLLGMSYGTRVALVYGYLHPEVIDRSVMIGVCPPGRFMWDPKMIDRQLAYYDSLFAADTLHYDGRPLSQSIRNSFAKMPGHWSLFRLDPGKIKVITFAMLFQKGSTAIVFDCYRAAERGDYGGLYMLQRAYDFMMPSMMVWGDLFAKGSTDFDAEVDYRRIFRDSTTVMGSPMSLLISGGTFRHWPVHRLPPEADGIHRSEVRTLLVSGSVDFSDPPSYATEELLPSLPNGRQVILHEMGHVGDMVGFQRQALEHLLSRFYDEGVVDDSQYHYDPMNFEPALSFPLWAKVLYPFVLILSIF